MAREVIPISARSDTQLLDKINEFLERIIIKILIVLAF